MTLGTGCPISGSSSQKINTRSLTEAELVGVDDTIAFMEWASLHSKDQVKKYPVTHPLKEMGTKTVVEQDNTSTIKLIKGDKGVCGQRTRNILIGCFYTHKRVDDGTITVVYCPTKEMTSDYLSKLLQESLIRLHRNTLMGLTPALDIQYKLSYAKDKALRVQKAIDYYSK